MTEQNGQNPFADEAIAANTPPGAEGPVGTGVEGADDILEADRARDAQDASFDAADVPETLSADELTAAEQGNREGDEMVAEGNSAGENIELAGDAANLDTVGDPGFATPELAADLEGNSAQTPGEDPLAGRP